MRSRRPIARRRGFTMIEIMIVLTIMAIVTVLGMDTVSSFDATQRPERAAREALAFFRYARHLAATTGGDAKVQIDTAANTFAVYVKSNGIDWDATPIAQPMSSGGTMMVKLNTERGLAGTTMTLTPATTTAFVYGPLGSCAATGKITFRFGNYSKSLTVPAVGEPQIN